ncbi:MAG: TetR/AcrR family transcriptional regulator [Myxococcota bacterium]|nr:TetR/AcrR family transcriptional regulator [Myxococcota bacterium]
MSQITLEPAPARPGRAERTRQRILDAAGQSFAAAGYAKTTVEDIAARAGVSKGLVYHHFRGKEAVHRAVLRRTLDDWHEACRGEGGRVLERIAAMLRRALAYAKDNPLLHALFRLDQLVLLDTASRGVVKESLERMHTELVELLQEGMATGELRDDLDVTHVADLIRIQQMAFIDHVLNPEWIDASDDGLVEAGIAVLCNGLARERAR